MEYANVIASVSFSFYCYFVLIHMFIHFTVGILLDFILFIVIHTSIGIKTIIILFLLIFAMVGVQLFNGKFFYCNDESMNNAEDCQYATKYFENKSKI